MSLVLSGSTSGSVTLQEPAIAGTTVLTLPAVSGTVLTTASSGQSIPKAALPTGSLLQVVQTAYTTADSTTAAGPGSFSSTGCTASITPTSSSSKILAMLSMATYHASAAMQGGARIMRGSSAAFSGITLDYWAPGPGSGISGNINIQWLDSPNTTSSTTYTAQFSTWGGGTLEINKDFNSNNNGVTYLTLLEIAA
jgi:hypothetical protein